MPHNIKEDMRNQSVIGERLFDTFVKDRIQSERVNILSKMKKTESFVPGRPMQRR